MLVETGRVLKEEWKDKKGVVVKGNGLVKVEGSESGERKSKGGRK